MSLSLLVNANANANWYSMKKKEKKKKKKKQRLLCLVCCMRKTMLATTKSIQTDILYVTLSLILVNCVATLCCYLLCSVLSNAGKKNKKTSVLKFSTPAVAALKWCICQTMHTNALLPAHLKLITLHTPLYFFHNINAGSHKVPRRRTSRPVGSIAQRYKN